MSKEVQDIAEKLAKEICPHAFDKTQKDYIKNALIEFAKAIIEATREDYKKNFWP
jgi:hypothetical protein